MTTYTLDGTPGSYDWGTPTSWVGGVVPNAPDADVVFPVVTMTSTGQPVSSQVQITSGVYAIRSLAVNADELDVLGGSLAVSGAVSLMPTGSIEVGVPVTVGSLSNQGTVSGTGGAAQLTSTGAVTNSGSLGTIRLDPNLFRPSATQVGLTLAAASFTNTGTVAGVLIDMPAGGFTNFQDGTLTGGRYVDPALNLGGTLVTDAADLSLYFDPTSATYANGPSDEEFDPASGTYVPIESTLRTIASTGSLTTGASYTASSLTVDGSLTESLGGTVSIGQLTIGAGGRAAISGTLTGTIVVDGTLTIAPFTYYIPGFDPTIWSLLIDGAVTGTGTIELPSSTPDYYNPGSTLELAGAASATVAFDDQYGILKFDQVGSFTGSIKPFGSGDTIALAGVALSSVTGETYAQDATGGTLTLTESGGGAIRLHFLGTDAQTSFALSAGPQPYSTSPPSLDITVERLQQTGNAFYVDGSHGQQSFQGTGNPNFINTSGAAGTGDVAVDLTHGFVTKGGQLDATFTNIQGVQLGADTSAILGLTSGTDLLYGGSGTDTFNGNGATDYIQGGTGTNIVQGGSGNEIFYGNGGQDVMRGGSAANFMSGGPTGSSTDVFYGTTGNDYVYGNGGAVDLVGGSGSEFLSAGSGFNELDDRNQAAGPVGASVLVGSTGTDLFYAGIGTNMIDEGSGTDTFVGSSGTDQVYGGAGRSFTYAGSGTDTVSTGAGNDYVKAGSGALSFNDTAANLHAGRFDQIDGFSGSRSTDLYLPGSVQGATQFISQNGGTAILTAVGGGTAEVFVSNTGVAQVQAHTHFTL